VVRDSLNRQSHGDSLRRYPALRAAGSGHCREHVLPLRTQPFSSNTPEPGQREPGLAAVLPTAVEVSAFEDAGRDRKAELPVQDDLLRKFTAHVSCGAPTRLGVA